MLLAPNFIRKKGRPGLQAEGEALADSRETLCFIAGPANPSHGAPSGELRRSCTHAQEYKAQKLRAPHAKRAMLAVQTMIHRTQRTPLRWHCSQATAIDKHNGKTGAQGSRLIHVLDPWGKGFYATTHVLEPLGPNDTGFAANRRREYATLTQNTVNEKLRRLGRCYINNNHDCTNAFCCTTHVKCDEVCDQLFSTAADRGTRQAQTLME